MDGSSTITVSVVFAVIGCIGAVVAIINNRDAKKTREGKFEGVVETELKNLSVLMQGNINVQSAMQGDIRLLDSRMTVLETSHNMNHRQRALKE